MKRRPRRSIPATLTALVVLAAVSLTAVVTIQLIIGERPWIDYATVAGALHGTRWNELPLALGGALFVLLGLLLLFAAILPGRLTVLPLRAENSGAARHSYQSTLRSAATSVDGVSRAKLTVRRRRIDARVRTARTNPTGLADAVRAALEHRLGQIDPAVSPRISVKVVRSAK